MSAPEQTATDRLAELDRRISAGERIDPADYLVVRTEAELEVRQQQAAERVAAEQASLDAKLLRRRRIDEARDIVPQAIRDIAEAVATAVRRHEDSPDKGLRDPGPLTAGVPDLLTLWGRLSDALDAGAPAPGRQPTHDLLARAAWLESDVRGPWETLCDVTGPVAALNSALRPLRAEF